MDKHYTYAQLSAFTQAVFRAIGCPEADAVTATHSLLAADLRGVDSHGVARLSGYVRLNEVDRIHTQPHIHIVHESPSTAVVNGDRGLGLVVAPFAMHAAIGKARQCGTGWVAVKNSNHFGIAGHYAMMALPHDMIGITMTNASALVAPTFSIDRLLGTNPIAVAVPAGTEHPFVADFATTTAANGKLELLQRKNADTPAGWVQTNSGEPSVNANILKEGGALLPLGGDREHGSHKGYALGAIVDIFSGILSGANFGPWVPPFPAYVPMPEDQPGEGIGHFFGAMRIDAFRTAGAFKTDMDKWIRHFKSAGTVAGQQRVIIPGEPEREMEEERRMNGIPLVDSVVKELKELGSRFGIDL